jgi:hypothetical protein
MHTLGRYSVHKQQTGMILFNSSRPVIYLCVWAAYVFLRSPGDVVTYAAVILGKVFHIKSVWVLTRYMSTTRMMCTIYSIADVYCVHFVINQDNYSNMCIQVTPLLGTTTALTKKRALYFNLSECGLITFNTASISVNFNLLYVCGIQ